MTVGKNIRGMAVTGGDWLDIWERAQGRSLVEKALRMASAGDTAGYDRLAALSIGQRDARLLQIRQSLFGSQIVSLASCPVCGEKLELSFSVADIWQNVAPPVGSLVVEQDGYQVEFRLPTSRDIATLSQSYDLAAARQELLHSSLLQVQYDGADYAGELPEAVAEAVVAAMEEADPQADIQLALTCLNCGHNWQAVFDIVTFLWSELTSFAHKLLSEVHTIASVYGWREADILALSAARRQYYLEMIANERLSV